MRAATGGEQNHPEKRYWSLFFTSHQTTQITTSGGQHEVIEGSPSLGARPTGYSKRTPSPAVLRLALQSGGLTATGIRQLCPAKEAKVASPCPNGLGVSEAQPGAEVVSVKCLLAIDRVVASGIVGTAHPDLVGRGRQEDTQTTQC